jgi:hypothetical protein
MEETRQLSQMEGSPIYELFQAIDLHYTNLVYRYQHPQTGRVGGMSFDRERTLDHITMLIEAVEELADANHLGERAAWQLYADQLKDDVFELLNNK